ncbi:hypothetical protein KPH14_007058 [Odynerus spinipes]|uniref:Uncharacterized protein n=1 Tax=Odynerus spinipes TaxID=1348599 RepID=A0AAD9RSC6_9HYME|nr:hypothetical protein KPH14_007058 [Odynerus spinipes]
MIPSVRNVLLLALVRLVVCFHYEPGDISDSLLSGSILEQDKSEQVNFNKELSDNQDNSNKYDKGESTNHERKQDSARYDELDKTSEGFDKDKHTSGHTEILNEADNSFESHGTGNHKKGYHKTGFSNNYHKDESGNKTSFYEDSDDAKGHSSFDKNGGSYGKNLLDSFKDGIHDASFRERNRAEKGDYDNGRRYDDSRGHYEQYRNNHRYDDGRKYFHDDIGQRYDRNRDHFRDYNYRNYPYAFDNGFVSSRSYHNYQVDAQPKFHSGSPYVSEYLRNYRYFPDYRDRRIYYPDDVYYDDAYRARYYNTNYRDNRFGNRYLP